MLSEKKIKKLIEEAVQNVLNSLEEWDLNESEYLVQDIQTENIKTEHEADDLIRDWIKDRLHAYADSL
jgi:uncharacterized protein YPO0396